MGELYEFCAKDEGVGSCPVYDVMQVPWVPSPCCTFVCVRQVGLIHRQVVSLSPEVRWFYGESDRWTAFATEVEDARIVI
jgi:hypothetical protein